MKVKKKKTLAQKIAEKEAAAEEARLEALAAEEEDTPEARWLIFDCHPFFAHFALSCKDNH